MLTQKFIYRQSIFKEKKAERIQPPIKTGTNTVRPRSAYLLPCEQAVPQWAQSPPHAHVPFLFFLLMIILHTIAPMRTASAPPTSHVAIIYFILLIF